jgi:hypothetical protein
MCHGTSRQITDSEMHQTKVSGVKMRILHHHFTAVRLTDNSTSAHKMDPAYLGQNQGHL